MIRVYWLTKRDSTVWSKHPTTQKELAFKPYAMHTISSFWKPHESGFLRIRKLAVLCSHLQLLNGDNKNVQCIKLPYIHADLYGRN